MVLFNRSLQRNSGNYQVTGNSNRNGQEIFLGCVVNPKGQYGIIFCEGQRKTGSRTENGGVGPEVSADFVRKETGSNPTQYSNAFSVK
jgi:hypothetical protein